MKRLLSLTLAFILLCSVALADSYPITLTSVKAKGKTGYEWLADEAGRVSLMRQVANIMRKDKTMKKKFGGFKIDAAISTACTGLDEDGNLFVAMLNPNTNAMLAVVVNPETFEGEFTVMSRSQRTFEKYQSMSQKARATTYSYTPNDIKTQVGAFQDPDAKPPEAVNEIQTSLFKRGTDTRTATFELLQDGYQKLLTQKLSLESDEMASSFAAMALLETSVVVPVTYDGAFEDELDGLLKGSVNVFGRVAFGQNPGTNSIAFMYYYAHSNMALLVQYEHGARQGTRRCYTDVDASIVNEFLSAYETSRALDINSVNKDFLALYQATQQ